MSTRLKMGKVQPAAYEAIDALDSYLETTSIPALHKELIKIRASQINGCAYCVNTHSHDARKLGASEAKVYLTAVWREAENVFDEEERLVLTMTEEITLIHQHGLRDETYEKAIEIFGEERTAQVIMAIITINVWNRIGVGLKMQPQIKQEYESDTVRAVQHTN